MNTLGYLDLIAGDEALRETWGEVSDYRIAKLLHVSQPTISGYRTGKREADEDTAVRIALLLGKEPIEVVADLKAQRAEAEGNKPLANLWRNMAAKVMGLPPVTVSPIRLEDVVAVTPRKLAPMPLGGAPMMADAAMMKTRRVGGGHKKATGISDGLFVFDLSERPGSDGRNRTADLGVMNPSL